MHGCQICGSDLVTSSVDFDLQPISNRFLNVPDASETRFHLSLEQCARCGAVHQVYPPPADELRPRFAWVTYNEPEGHLDELAAKIWGLAGIDAETSALGISFKDDSLLARLRGLGVQKTYRLDLETDLGIDDAGVGIETIQHRLTVDTARAIVARRGLADLIIARHVIEHAHDLPEFLSAIRTLLKPGGYTVVEVPDCSVCFELCDYTTVWEEHVHYFTRETCPAIFRQMGQVLVSMDSYPARPEGLLVGIGRDAGTDAESTSLRQPCLTEFRGFVDNFPAIKRLAAERLEGMGPVAILGAGHLACAFINYLKIVEFVDFVVDDSPHKQGLFMPGSKLPIRGSDSLVSQRVRLCLLSVNPEVEERVIRRNQAFTDQGGRFASIFASSPRYVLR